MSDVHAIEPLLRDFRNDLREAQTPEQAEAVRVRHLGKKSALKAAFGNIAKLQGDDKAQYADALNRARADMEMELEQRTRELDAAQLERRFAAEWIDLSLPGVAPRRGARHPLSEIEQRCSGVLRELGFEFADGPEVETAYYNFDALNISEDHPARDAQDTFWITGGLLLRSHTTSVQARVLSRRPKPPIKIVSPGRAYRNETVDASHLAMFHQYEGLWVEAGLTVADLKGVLSYVAERLYGAEHAFRFKPKFYPYTEPSIGMDMACSVCHGEGCRACGHSGWVTILGAGMVHGAVFREFGYDPAEIQGIAFGLGISRMAAQWSAVSPMKRLYEQDLRVHEQVARGQR